MKLPVRRHEVVQPLNESYRFIPLTQGQNAIVDAEDFRWLSKHNWHAFWAKNTRSFYAGRWNGKRKMSMHRAILKCKYADHKNHDTLDNRRDNLRKCSRSQNAANRKLNKNNPCGFKGVSYRKDGSAWVARIRFNNKPRFLGRFRSAKEAALRYDIEAIKLHGEFAHLNFPSIEM